MEEQGSWFHRVTQDDPRLSAHHGKSFRVQPSYKPDTAQLSGRWTKALHDLRLTGQDVQIFGDSLDHFDATNEFQETEPTFHQPPTTTSTSESLRMPASFYNIPNVWTPPMNVASQQPATTRSTASTAGNPDGSSSMASAFNSFPSHSHADTGYPNPSPPSTDPLSLAPTIPLLDNPAQPTSRSAQIVYVNFAMTEINEDGSINLVNNSLLCNTRGFPVDLNEIKTIASLNAIILTYFARTLGYYGLNLHHLSGYAGLFYSSSAGLYSYTLGPASTHESWREIFGYLVGETAPQNHCAIRKCSYCLNPPLILACFDESALSNALLSKGVDASVGMEFLDGTAQVLTAKHDRSASELKTAYMRLKTEAANGSLVKSLASTATNPHQYTLRHISQDQAELFSNNTSVGRVQISQLLTPMIPGVVGNGSSLAVTAPVLTLSGAQATSTTPSDNDPSRGSLKRSADSDVDTPKRKLKRRNNWGNETPPPLPAERIKASDWEKATPKPKGNTKAPTDTCLTCISQNRACKGTVINAFGKCENCAGGEKGKSNKRKCYWADRDNGILTYDDARRAAGEDSRRLPQNTRAQRALRDQPSNQSSATNAPQVLTMVLIGNILVPFTNHFPTVSNQASATTSQFQTPSALTNNVETPGSETTGATSFTHTSTHDDDSSSLFYDDDSFDPALNAFSNEAQTNDYGDQDYNNLYSIEGTNEENPTGFDETTGTM